ncbi:MAG: pilus assembly protein PilP [Candidatus Binatia bacterium]
MSTMRFYKCTLSLACLGLSFSAVPVRGLPFAHAQENGGEEAYHYNPTGKRDPFFSPLHRVTEQPAAPDETKTPLQRLDLGQFKLVGVILDTEEPKALVEDNSGLGYIVTRGTLIGSKGGMIKSIESRRVLVEEYETDFFGKRQSLERELNLTVGDSSPEMEK